MLHPSLDAHDSRGEVVLGPHEGDRELAANTAGDLEGKTRDQIEANDLASIRLAKGLGSRPVPTPSRRVPGGGWVPDEGVLILWKDADPDTPILRQAKAEYAMLRQANVLSLVTRRLLIFHLLKSGWNLEQTCVKRTVGNRCNFRGHVHERPAGVRR